MRDVNRLIARRKLQDRLFSLLGMACTLVGVLTLVVLLSGLIRDGSGRLFDPAFYSSFPSARAVRAGILSPLVDSLLLALLTVLLAVPLGVAAGVYLEEYAPRNWLTTIIEINIANLAGVPSIIFGLLALGFLIYGLGMSRSLLVGAIALSCLVLPIVIVTTREALRAIPNGIREAAYALGATKWQVVQHHLLPYSLGGIATGTIIAMSRALGESAPLMTIGAVTFISFLPPAPWQSNFPFVNMQWLDSEFTAMPIQMFNWISRPQAEFTRLAAAAGVVLIAMTLSLNAAAITLRYRLRKRIKW
ncbi:MAG: phosphate ABC transporter permease PstA [Planctomycetaceae bacterium]|jgi:phosphate transport system permease protein